MSALHERIFDPQGECVDVDGYVSPKRLDCAVPRPPKGYQRHHTCGNAACLNPDHVVVVSFAFHGQLHNPYGVEDVER
jgi:hypothetical protein